MVGSRWRAASPMMSAAWAWMKKSMPTASASAPSFTALSIPAARSSGPRTSTSRALSPSAWVTRIVSCHWGGDTGLPMLRRAADAGRARHRLLDQLHALALQLGHAGAEPGDVAARPGELGYHARTDRLAD